MKLNYRKLFFILFFFNIIILALVFTPLTNHLARMLEVPGDLRKADVIIILSSEMYNEDIMGKNTYQRLLYAFDLHHKGLAPRIIITGGAITDNPASISWGMKNILKKMGISEDKIIIEDTSHNTYENLKNAREIMKKHNMNSALLVTSCYHMYRAANTAGRLRMQIYPAPVSCYEKDIRGAALRQSIVYNICREYLAILYFKIRGWI